MKSEKADYNMPAIPCSHAPECSYVTDPEATIGEAIVLLQMNEKAKLERETVTSSLKADKVRRPTITGGGSSEDWQYFITRWEEYSAATKLSESDKVLQLLECCDEQLKRDLTRVAGGTLSAKPENEVIEAIKSLLFARKTRWLLDSLSIRWHKIQMNRFETLGPESKGKQMYATTAMNVKTAITTLTTRMRFYVMYLCVA